MTMNAVTVHVVCYSVRSTNGAFTGWYEVHGVAQVVLRCDLEVVPLHFAPSRPKFGLAVVLTENMAYATTESVEELASLLDARIIPRPSVT